VQNNGWSQVSFGDPVASQSCTLLILIEYPQNYNPQPNVPALGVGYANEAADRHHFVTEDRTQWYKVTSRYWVLAQTADEKYVRKLLPVR
jgi:hypothetical protein